MSSIETFKPGSTRLTVNILVTLSNTKVFELLSFAFNVTV